jgi:uncharacterized protein YebE (UPF0316 family)
MGIKYLAPIIAFSEIVIWLLCHRSRDEGSFFNISHFLASAFGYAMGTYIGLVIEGKLINGMVILRIVTTEDSTHEIVSFMQSENYGITPLDATGSRGNVKMILSLVNRIDVPRTTAHLQSINPLAFFSIEDVRYVNEGVFRSKKAKTLSPVCFIRFTTPKEKIAS